MTHLNISLNATKGSDADQTGSIHVKIKYTLLTCLNKVHTTYSTVKQLYTYCLTRKNLKTLFNLQRQNEFYEHFTRIWFCHCFHSTPTQNQLLSTSLLLYSTTTLQKLTISSFSSRSWLKEWAVEDLFFWQLNEWKPLLNNINVCAAVQKYSLICFPTKVYITVVVSNE